MNFVFCIEFMVNADYLFLAVQHNHFGDFQLQFYTCIARE